MFLTEQHTRDVFAVHDGQWQMPPTTAMLEAAQFWADKWSERYEGTDVAKLWRALAIVNVQPADNLSLIRDWEHLFGKTVLPDPAQ